MLWLASPFLLVLSKTRRKLGRTWRKDDAFGEDKEEERRRYWGGQGGLSSLSSPRQGGNWGGQGGQATLLGRTRRKGDASHSFSSLSSSIFLKTVVRARQFTNALVLHSYAEVSGLTITGREFWLWRDIQSCIPSSRPLLYRTSSTRSFT